MDKKRPLLFAPSRRRGFLRILQAKRHERQLAACLRMAAAGQSAVLCHGLFPFQKPNPKCHDIRSWWEKIGNRPLSIVTDRRGSTCNSPSMEIKKLLDENISCCTQVPYLAKSPVQLTPNMPLTHMHFFRPRLGFAIFSARRVVRSSVYCPGAPSGRLLTTFTVLLGNTTSLSSYPMRGCSSATRTWVTCPYAYCLMHTLYTMPIAVQRFDVLRVSQLA